jgi:dienelactone hydrolase
MKQCGGVCATFIGLAIILAGVTGCATVPPTTVLGEGQSGTIAFPPCNITFIDDEQVSDRPIRIFHGTADDYTPIEPCRQYVERLHHVGKDVQLIEYSGAHHGFDRSAPRYLLQAQNPSRCLAEERPGGVLVNRDTGQPASFNDPCMSRGATVGYDPRAADGAFQAVRAFLTATFKLSG